MLPRNSSCISFGPSLPQEGISATTTYDRPLGHSKWISLKVSIYRPILACIHLRLHYLHLYALKDARLAFVLVQVTSKTHLEALNVYHRAQMARVSDNLGRQALCGPRQVPQSRGRGRSRRKERGHEGSNGACPADFHIILTMRWVLGRFLDPKLSKEVLMSHLGHCFGLMKPIFAMLGIRYDVFRKAQSFPLLRYWYRRACRFDERTGIITAGLPLTVTLFAAITATRWRLSRRFRA